MNKTQAITIYSSPPTLSNVSTNVKWGEIIYATSNQIGDIYIVPKGTYINRAALNAVEPKVIDVCDADISTGFSTSHLKDGIYQAYAFNLDNTLSAPSSDIIVTGCPPDAPNVTEDDTMNKIVGADATMEYSMNWGVTWISYDTVNEPIFTGNKNVNIRVKANGDIPAGNREFLFFTENPVVPVTPGALGVTINDTTNKILGADTTAEYSTDGGNTWTNYDTANEPTFPGTQTVQIRVKAEGINPAGIVTALFFSEDTVTPVTPGALSVTINDSINKIINVDAKAEYSIDGGNTWTSYDIANEPTFHGTQTVQIRVKAEGINPAGVITTLYFTESTVIPWVAPIATPPEDTKDTTKEVRQININGENDINTVTLATIDIVREVKENKIIDTVVLDQTKTQEILQKVIEQQDLVQIVVDNIPDNKADEVSVTINKDSVKQLSDNKVVLEVKTEEVSIQIPKETLQVISENNDDLYFRVVPIKDKEQQTEAFQNAITAEVVQKVAGNSEVQALGIPMIIETNYQNLNTKVIFSLKDITLPTNETSRKEFLDSLAVYISHSDGEKELIHGTLKYDEVGNPIGIVIEISKFSTFTIVSISNVAPTASALTITGKAVVENELTAAFTYSDIDKDEQGDSIVSWYRAKSKSGKNKTLISEGSQLTYKVTKKDQGKYLFVEVTPVAKTGKLIGQTVSTSIKVAVNMAPKVVSVMIKGKTTVGSTLTASYTYKDAENDKEGKSVYQWYLADNTNGENKQAIKGANELTYTLAKEDLGKYIIFEVIPIAKTGSKNGDKAIASTEKSVNEPEIKYNCHVKFGLIGSKTYAEKIAKLIELDYQTANVEVKKEGKYYRVYVDFANKAAAHATCKDMIKRNYIANYYFYEK